MGHDEGDRRCRIPLLPSLLPAVSFFFLGAGTMTQQRRVQVKGHGDDASFSLLATPTEQKEEASLLPCMGLHMTSKEEASRGKAYEETGEKAWAKRRMIKDV